MSEAEWRALLDPPPPIDLNVAVPAFRNYLRDYRPQVRAGFELAEMAGGRIKPAEWEAEAAKQRAEWRERLPVDCPPPPPHRPPVWNQAEFEADMDNLTRALDALQQTVAAESLAAVIGSWRPGTSGFTGSAATEGKCPTPTSSLS